jgi:micrococcal nuclease
MSHAQSLTRRRPALVAVAGAAVVLVVALFVTTPWSVGRFHPPGAGDGDGGLGTGRARVVRVVDGDTLIAEVAGAEERIRLIGIDTPETVAPNRPVECYGPEASHRLGELLPAGTAIRLERDVEPRDPYDRLLAYVYRSDDGLFVNQAQVSGGFAEAREYPPNTARRPELDGAEQAARTAGAGLWGACGGADTPLAGSSTG